LISEAGPFSKIGKARVHFSSVGKYLLQKQEKGGKHFYFLSTCQMRGKLHAFNL